MSEDTASHSAAVAPIIKGKYTRVTNEQRRDLIKLVYTDRYTIKEAALRVGIPYPNAKAVNQTYLAEGRTTKK